MDALTTSERCKRMSLARGKDAQPTTPMAGHDRASGLSCGIYDQHRTCTEAKRSRLR